MSTCADGGQPTANNDYLDDALVMKRKVAELSIADNAPSTSKPYEGTSQSPTDPFSMTGGSPCSVLGPPEETLAAAAAGRGGAGAGKQMRQDEGAEVPPIRRSSSIIDQLLSDSMGSFLSEGALVAPSRCMKMSDILMECCDSRGFTYGIYWALDDAKQLLVARDRYSLPAAGGGAPVGRGSNDSSQVFCETSAALTAFPVGLGMPGRVSFHGGHEWRCGDFGSEDKGKFHRQELAANNSIHTIMGVAVPGGVIELGSTELIEEQMATVRHVRTLCTNFDPRQA